MNTDEERDKITEELSNAGMLAEVDLSEFEELAAQFDRDSILELQVPDFSGLDDKDKFIAITKYIGSPRYIDMFGLSEDDKQWYLAQFKDSE